MEEGVTSDIEKDLAFKFALDYRETRVETGRTVKR